MGEAAQKKILIVEDDQDQSEAISLVLEKEGYATIGATDSAEGLAKARSEKPDLVLLDVMMPTGTEGFHFVWELRRDADKKLAETPIIVLTAIHQTTPLRLYPEQSDTAYGPYEYLPVQAFFDKPVAFPRLLAEIKKLLG